MKFPSKEVDKRVDVPPDIVSRAYEGDATAQLMLGKAYLKAIYAENNDHIALDWILRSAEQGNMEAQFRLGDLYALGQGTIKSLPDAYTWYTKAAIQGYKKALIRIHNLYQEDIKMHCRGQINSEEEEWASSKFMRNNYIRELNEYRMERNKSILNGAVDYYTGQIEKYRSSNQGDPTVQLNLAFLYQHGYGLYRYGRVMKNILLAFEYYTMAAEQGSIDAQYNLGNLYQKHTDIKFNYRQAFKWYTKSAHGGNIAAQKSLAYFYLKGLATDIDYDVALAWYTKAAEAGDSAAQVILGKLYRKGECVKRDLSIAVRWYTLAARQGNIVARNCLAQLYQRDMLNNVELDDDMLEYLTEDSMNSRLCTKLSLDVSKLGDSPRFKQLNELAKRALIGDGQAMYEIGLKYFQDNDDFTQDQEIGIKWIKNAANAKHKGAQLMIADLYKKGESIEQDYHKTAIWYKTLAKKRDAQLQCNAGVMYNKGLGVRKDPLEASKWFTWAADQGNSDGQYYFGMLRLKGRGIRQDEEEAVKWFLKSAYQRNIQACYEIGKVYLKGKHQIEQNTKRGLALLEYAANNGFVDAQLKLGERYKSKGEEYFDLSKSILYYTMAADSGDWIAQYTLTNIYLEENDIDSNYIKMYNWFTRGIYKEYEFLMFFLETPMKRLYGGDFSKILNMLIDATKKGLYNLHYNIGFWYEHGVNDYIGGVDINHPSAIEWYLTASDNGDSRADYRLGIMHEYGKHFESNMDTAISYYNKASLRGNTDATYKLGSIYANGYGVAQDLLKAYHLFTKAFSMGNEDAGKELKVKRSYNIMHSSPSDNSTGDPEISLDRATRISMLEKATEEGFTGLQYQLGVMYEKLNNQQMAFKWLSLAAEIGVTDAYFRLGVLYEEGRGVHKDYTMAAKMYQHAAEKEHEDASYKIGRLFEYGLGVERDYLAAYRFYKKAADMGQPKAQKVLNITHEARISSNTDTEEPFFDTSSSEYSDSISMCKYVAEQGDTEMQFKVGFAYEHNYSVPDFMEVCKWYSLAAKNSHKEAIYRLGFLYEQGLGVPQNYSKAYELYQQAGQLGSDDALFRLGKAYHHGNGVEIDVTKAIEYYTLSAEYGNPEYQSELGRLFEKGELVQKDLLEALKWYTKAYMQGYDSIRPTLYDMDYDMPYEDFFYKKLFPILKFIAYSRSRFNESSYDKADALYRSGIAYYYGNGVKTNIENAIEYDQSVLEQLFQIAYSRDWKSEYTLI